MSKEIVEIPASRLRIGDYVSRLDRPWTDTPFLFQGFAIKSEEELQVLRDLCKVVYVESSAAADRQPRPGISKPPAASSVHQTEPLEELATNPAALVERTPAKDPVPLKTELTLAVTTFGEAKRAVGGFFDNLRRGGGVDVVTLQTTVGSIVDSVFRNRDAMGWLTRMKNTDDYLYNHSLAASVWAIAFGRHLGLDKETLQSVGTGAMLLDIGKTRLPTILLKKAGKLDYKEWQLVHAHVEVGIELLRSAPNVDERVLTMIQTHHERFDGSGYPHKLKGDEIPLVGRIAGIVDCYDAMISDRIYAKPMSTYDAVRELKRFGGISFPAELVELFIQAVGVFPTGTLVELNTGEVGVVIGQNRYRRLRPELMLILDAQKKVRAQFTTIDLLTCDENVAGREPKLWIKHGVERGAYGIDPADYFL